MGEIKSKIATLFKLLELSQKDSTKILARHKDSEVQKRVSYIKQRLDAIQDMKYQVQEMMIGENGIVDEWVRITNEKMERYQELVDRLKGCQEDLRKKKEAEIRKKEDEIQEERFKGTMEEELKIKEMKLEMKKNKDKDIIVNKNIQVKRPRLVITKFEGTHLDWF